MRQHGLLRNVNEREAGLELLPVQPAKQASNLVVELIVLAHSGVCIAESVSEIVPQSAIGMEATGVQAAQGGEPVDHLREAAFSGYSAAHPPRSRRR